MLILKDLLERKEEYIFRYSIRNYEIKDKINKLEELYNRKKVLSQELDKHREFVNKNSKLIGKLISEKKIEEAEELKQTIGKIKKEIQEKENILSNIEEEIFSNLIDIPNAPHISVPVGRNSKDNLIVKEKSFELNNDNLLPHWELGKKYGIIDFEAGANVCGSGFVVYKGKGAVLQRALISFFLDKAKEKGFEEYWLPCLVNENAAFGTGQLPDKEGQMYKIENEKFYLIPTAEVPLTNLFRNIIFDEDELPKKIVSYTPCFRREAGSYGQMVRGLNRLHQFDKVEIVIIDHPKRSYNTLEEMVNYVESLVELLELPYRVVKLCGGDLGFTSAMTYDIEVYSPAQKMWLEISSISNFEAFQANRINIKYRDKETKKNNFCHTLNGSALALPRLVAALLEFNQCFEGIKIPKVLIPYTKFELIN